LLLPGGVINPDMLRIDPSGCVCESFFDAGKPVAAICHGPGPSLSRSCPAGRSLHGHRSRPTLRNAGAEWIDKEAVTDGICQRRKPDDIRHSIVP